MGRANNVVNEVKVQRRGQGRACPDSAFASELAMKNKWEDRENRREAEIPKNWNAGVFLLEMTQMPGVFEQDGGDRKSTRLNSSHLGISYAVFCLKKKKQ